MCFFSPPKLRPLDVVDPNAGKAAAEAEMMTRRRASGFASTIKTTSSAASSPGAKLLLGE
jgi:hypothetical protein